MSKEIIIDGVDVSECNFHLERDNKQKCECCHATGFGVICDCEAWHNCYYKQLQRLKQENELLHQDLKSCGINREAYKQALEEIREIVNEPCMEGEDCNTCDLWCPTKEIIVIINEVLK